MTSAGCRVAAGAWVALAAAFAPAGYAQSPPKGNWQVPGEIQKPRDVWQKPGDIQVPRGIEAVKATESKCERRLAVVADALFEFDKSALGADAKTTLDVLAPQVAKERSHPAIVEGHTDAVGADDYNRRLSEARAVTVRDWLVAAGALPAGTPVRGYGKTRPVAPNTTADGRDDPAGRQKNRRVEVVVDTCQTRK